MTIEVFGAYHHLASKDMRNTQAVVIDTLRATSVMITALKNGCLQVVPAIEIEEAMRRKRTMSEQNVLLGGERDALKIPGFDLGNSPKEYKRETVEGKVLVLTTTNGTAALHRAGGAKRVLIGAMNNASAVAKRLAQDPGPTHIVCAGTRGKFSLDDIYTAGCILSRLRELVPALEIDDLGFASEMMYHRYRNNWRDLVSNAVHYNVLIKSGFAGDIDYCMQEDTADIVPEWTDGIVM